MYFTHYYSTRFCYGRSQRETAQNNLSEGEESNNFVDHIFNPHTPKLQGRNFLRGGGEKIRQKEHQDISLNFIEELLP